MSRLQRIVQRSSLKKRVANARQIQHAQDNIQSIIIDAFERGISEQKERLEKSTSHLTYE